MSCEKFSLKSSYIGTIFIFMIGCAKQGDQIRCSFMDMLVDVVVEVVGLAMEIIK